LRRGFAPLPAGTLSPAGDWPTPGPPVFPHSRSARLSRRRPVERSRLLSSTWSGKARMSARRPSTRGKTRASLPPLPRPGEEGGLEGREVSGYSSPRNGRKVPTLRARASRPLSLVVADAEGFREEADVAEPEAGQAVSYSTTTWSSSPLLARFRILRRPCRFSLTPARHLGHRLVGPAPLPGKGLQAGYLGLEEGLLLPRAHTGVEDGPGPGLRLRELEAQGEKSFHLVPPVPPAPSGGADGVKDPFPTRRGCCGGGRSAP